jgi:hypothetical protein
MKPAGEDPIKAGRYAGELVREPGGPDAVRFDVQVRLEPGGRTQLSADLFRRPAPEDASDPYLASLRATRSTATGHTWPVTWTDDDGHDAPGTAKLGAEPASVTVELALDAPGLGGIDPGTLSGTITWRGEELREIGIESEVEVGAESIRSVRHLDRDLDVAACLAAAGFAVTEAGQTTSIPQPQGEWHEADIFTELDTLMRNAANAPLDRASWTLHLLLLSRATRDGLFGLMFDHVGDLQRQGAAVFVGEIRRWATDQSDADRRILQTSLHELGHALNLMHRFSDQVRLVDSTSFMNYDWRYRGGCRSGDYWRDFAFTFDDDELDFLRHGAYPSVVPGGRPFGSVRYWPEPAPRDPIPELQLWLTPPRSGTTFVQGQPVYLEVSLRNTGQDPAYVQRHALDVKAGYLDLLVQRVQDGPEPPLASAFVPFVHRCFEAATAPDVPLTPGESLHANVNLAYGSTFAEPGAYDIRPVFTYAPFPDGSDDVTVVGDPLRIDVVPAPPVMQADLDLLLDRPVGAWITLGGAVALSNVGEELEELRARWLRDGIADATHPTVAAINRTAGIYAGRLGDDETAAVRLAETCSPAAVATFDPHTAEHTRRLWRSYASRVAQRYGPFAPAPATPGASGSTVPTVGAAPDVVVALTPLEETGPGPTRLVPGVALAAAQTGEDAERSWAVIAPVDADLAASARLEAVVLTTVDGVSEQVGVTDVDLVRSDPAARALAVVTLVRSIPVSRTAPVDRQAVEDALGQGADLWTALAGAGVVPATVAGAAGQLVGEWVDATLSAIASAPPPAVGFVPVPVMVTPHVDSALDELANWVCRLTPLCSLPDAPTAPWERARAGGSGLRRCPR